MVRGKFVTSVSELKEAFHIRREVFIEEQNIPEEFEFDEWDPLATHVLVYVENDDMRAVATGRLTLMNQEVADIGRIAVLKNFREKYYGEFTVRMLLNKALLSGCRQITLRTQTATKPFFEKIGFVQNGEEYIEAGNSYIRMVYAYDKLKTPCNSTNLV